MVPAAEEPACVNVRGVALAPGRVRRMGRLVISAVLLCVLPALAGGVPASRSGGIASSLRPGLLDPNAPRFMARARNIWCHFGWQKWHRAVDKEVREWVQENATAGLEEFLRFISDRRSSVAGVPRAASRAGRVNKGREGLDGRRPMTGGDADSRNNAATATAAARVRRDRVPPYIRGAFGSPEPCTRKRVCTVPRGGSGGNAAPLPSDGAGRLTSVTCAGLADHMARPALGK